MVMVVSKVRIHLIAAFATLFKPLTGKHDVAEHAGLVTSANTKKQKINLNLSLTWPRLYGLC